MVEVPVLVISFEDQEHLLFGTVRVVRTLSLAWRAFSQVVAKLSSSNTCTELSASRGVVPVVLDIGKHHVVEIDEGFHLGSSTEEGKLRQPDPSPSQRARR